MKRKGAGEKDPQLIAAVLAIVDQKQRRASLHALCLVRSLIYILKSTILILKLKFNNISSLRTSCAFNYFKFNFLTFV